IEYGLMGMRIKETIENKYSRPVGILKGMKIRVFPYKIKNICLYYPSLMTGEIDRENAISNNDFIIK
ncbi:MAG: hypothetical protein Q7I98_08155, partial [Erysipelotrichaceae bacterium]|nr:hypothetical protein [Erysipelotrichaceae bacterium]